MLDYLYSVMSSIFDKQSLNSFIYGLFCSYTWEIYANRLLNMGSMYTFWRTVNKEQKEAKQRYIHMFYNLLFKNLVR